KSSRTRDLSSRPTRRTHPYCRRRDQAKLPSGSVTPTAITPSLLALPSTRAGVLPMTYVVPEACIKCKFMDCVEVCPVDCFYEGENMLVIHPDECIDCGVCEP